MVKNYYVLLPYLPVLPPVQNGPRDLPRIPLKQVGAQAAALQEAEGLPVRLNEGATPTGVDLVPAVTAKVDPAKEKEPASVGHNPIHNWDTMSS